MKKPLPVSDELLNAFVDNELDAEAQERILQLESTNLDVKQAICELHRLKSQVKAARSTADFSDTNIRIRGSKKYYHWYTAAALVMALFIMMSMYKPFSNRDVISFSNNSTYADTASLLTAVSSEYNLKLVLHLSSAEIKAITQTMDLINAVLVNAERSHRQLEIEVIASGPGIKLLLEADTAYANRIQRLRHQYANLTFMACQDTIQKMLKKSGNKIDVLQGVKLVSSGPVWAKQRKKQGWAYVHI